MNLFQQIQPGPIEIAVGVLLILAVTLFGYQQYLARQNQTLTGNRGTLNKLKTDVKEAQKERKKLEVLRRSENNQIRQNQKIDGLRNTILNTLSRAKVENPERILGNQQSLPSTTLEDRNLKRKGSRFTFSRLPLTNLVNFLYLLESNYPTIQTKEIQLRNFRLPQKTIGEAQITFEYYEPIS